MPSNPNTFDAEYENAQISAGLKNLITQDWRVKMFGPTIRLNPKIEGTDDETDHDEEFVPDYIPTEEAFDTDSYDYIAVFIGANYCPHCKEFAPHVVKSAPLLEEKRRCKVVFVSGDRDNENFEASCKKNQGIDVMRYNPVKTRVFRDLFKLSTIPALLILRNKNFDEPEPALVINARNLLVNDPELENIQWEETKADVHSQELSLRDMLIISGKYGRWYELGHHINPEHPEKMYMNEHAVRIRAGLLNIISWFALFNIYKWNEPIFVYAIWPVVFLEMTSSMFIGLTPIAPLGTLATVMSYYLSPRPLWKPAEPKRFAWFIGFILVVMCMVVFSLKDEMGLEHARPWLAVTVILCNLATWFESAAGFCVGCFIYNNYLTKYLGLEECQECKL